MMKIKYKGYRIWAILQTNGKYRACLLQSPAPLNAAEVYAGPLIEGENQVDVIGMAKEFLDTIPIPEQNWDWPRTGTN
jgi:hypothetical protein